jgi:RNA polymerase sigma factor (sigma-70 family)
MYQPSTHVSEHAPLRAAPFVAGVRAPAQPSGGMGLGQLARDQYPALRRFVRGLGFSGEAAEDVVQAALLITLEALPRIVKGCERGFLYASAVRIAHGARRKGRRELVSGDLDADPSPDPAPDELAHRRRFRAHVEALLDGIECPCRTVFVLFELDGLTIPEIALVLAISRRAVMRCLRRARREVRDAPSSRVYAPSV